MNSELYVKSKEELMKILRDYSDDKKERESFIDSITVNFKDIEFHTYGDDIILKSTTNKIHLYTDGEFNIPSYNSKSDDNYFIVYNDKLYELSHCKINSCYDSFSEIDKEYKLAERRCYEEQFGRYLSRDVTQYEIDNYTMLRKIAEEDRYFDSIEENRLERDLEEGLFYIESYSTLQNELRKFLLKDCILTKYGLFIPINDVSFYSKEKDVVTRLSAAVGDYMNYSFSEKLKLVSKYKNKLF